jgi:hypothetical protein
MQLGASPYPGTKNVSGSLRSGKVIAKTEVEIHAADLVFLDNGCDKRFRRPESLASLIDASSRRALPSLSGHPALARRA